MTTHPLSSTFLRRLRGAVHEWRGPLVGALILLVGSSLAFAATGDIVVTDLHDTASAPANGTRTIQTSGCAPGGTGVCIKMDCSTGNCPGSDLWPLDVNRSEITLVWWEKYDAILANANCKSMRPYFDAGSSDYMFALITYCFGNTFYVSTWDAATLRPGSLTTGVAISPEFCSDAGGGVYDCPIRMKLDWGGMGTAWRKMKMWIKMPTSYTSGDGESKLWVDDELAYHLYAVDLPDRGPAPPRVTRVTFAPVDESSTPHGHWYDEITVYEGYVPPDAPIVAPSAPTNLRAQ